jgi:hypothetical protein
MDQIDVELIELLSRVTLSWENVEVNGESLECTPENAKKLYEEYYWLLQQVDTFVGERANFFRPDDAPALGSDQGSSSTPTPTKGQQG